MPKRDIVVIGASAGGPEALAEIVQRLPPAFPASIFVVVHFPAAVSSVLPRLLGRAGPLPAIHPEDGDPILPGHIYVARPDCHLAIQDRRVRVTGGPRENGHRPAIDPLFRSAAHAAGPRVIGLVLSGNLDDGTAGLLTIKQRGGITVVQSPETAQYPGMPRSAIAHVPVDHVVPLEAVADLLVRLTSEPVPALAARGAGRRTPLPTGDGEEAAADRSTQPGVPSTMTCPECHGTLWEVREGDLVRFRCRVGHAYTAETLLAQQADQIEGALWTALRALEEHAALARRLAERAGTRGQTTSAAALTEQAMDAEHHASSLRQVLDSGVRGQPGIASAVSQAAS